MKQIDHLYKLAAKFEDKSKYEIKSHMKKALKELKEKSLNNIQVSTALTWCGRACAAADMGKEDDATEYAHEAIEHAALSGHDDLLKFVKDCLKEHKVELFS
jgi:hypothetical protein